MTTAIPQLFAPTVLGGAVATIFTNSGTAGTVTYSVVVRFANTDTVTHQITAYAVPSGGTAGAGNCFANAVSIPPNGYLDTAVPVLASGDFVQAFADTASKVTVSCLSGFLFTS